MTAKIANRQEQFAARYAAEVAKDMARSPSEYGLDLGVTSEEIAHRAKLTAQRMTASMARKGANIHDSNAIRRTCRALGIRHTIGGLAAWLNGE